MVVSQKSHDANCRNAQQSRGPVSLEGKKAVRLNALTYGLRARDLILPRENPEEYQQVWAELLDEWKPQTRSERMALEQVATAYWLLARATRSETSIRITQHLTFQEMSRLVDRVYAQRTSLERSLAKGLAQLRQLQKDRLAAPAQAVQPKPAAVTEPRASVSGSPPAWLTSPEPVGQTIVLCGLPSSDPDTR